MSLHSNIDSGINAMKAMAFQVTGLMWLRTATNYQYRYGLPIKTTFIKLYKDGGIKRFYSGYLPCLTMGCLCRFGDMYSLSYINTNFPDNTLLNKSLATSTMSTFIRINLMPLDNLDNMLQVEGRNGLKNLRNKVNKYGLGVLYYGGSISIASNLVGNFSWFSMYYLLNKDTDSILYNSFLGFSCSMVSDVTTNPIRILKLNRQTLNTNTSYVEIFSNIYKNFGILEFWNRGLGIRLLSHGIQSSLFVTLWKYIENRT